MAVIDGNEIYFGIIGKVGEDVPTYGSYNETQTDQITDEVTEVTQ